MLLAQVAMSTALLANAKASIALVACGNTASPTYRTGVVAGSDGSRSYIIIANGVSVCVPARVYLSDDPSKAYLAKLETPDAFNAQSHGAPSGLLTIFSIGRFTTHIAQFAAGALSVGQPFVAVGYPTNVLGGGSETAKPQALMTSSGTLEGAPGLMMTASAPAGLGEGAALFDADSGKVIAIVTSVAPPMLGATPPPTLRFGVWQASIVTELLAALNPPVVPHESAQLSALAQSGLVAARVGSYTYVVMQKGSDPSQPYVYHDTGFAIVLGSTSATTILASFVDPASIDRTLLALPNPDGTAGKSAPKLIYHDSVSGLTFLSVPRIAGTATPVFESNFATGGIIAEPYAAFCTWAQTFLSVAACRITVGAPQPTTTSTALPAGYFQIGGGGEVLGIIVTGAPVLDVRSGYVAGIDTGGFIASALSVATLQRAARGAHLPVVLTTRP